MCPPLFATALHSNPCMYQSRHEHPRPGMHVLGVAGRSMQHGQILGNRCLPFARCLNLHLAKEVAILREILTHPTKKLYDDRTASFMLQLLGAPHLSRTAAFIVTLVSVSRGFTKSWVGQVASRSPINMHALDLTVSLDDQGHRNEFLCRVHGALSLICTFLV